MLAPEDERRLKRLEERDAERGREVDALRTQFASVIEGMKRFVTEAVAGVQGELKVNTEITREAREELKDARTERIKRSAKEELLEAQKKQAKEDAEIAEKAREHANKRFAVKASIIVALIAGVVALAVAAINSHYR